MNIGDKVTVVKPNSDREYGGFPFEGVVVAVTTTMAKVTKFINETDLGICKRGGNYGAGEWFGHSQCTVHKRIEQV